MREAINVTQTFLPSMEEYNSYLTKIWDSKWLTNRGALVLELEDKLKHFLSLDFLTLTTNGTLPLQIAIKALELKGEIITTPFSYVATTASIVWEGCKPVFVDIDPEYLTIDETKIEAAITDKTCAILATHVFGNPCDVDTIERIAEKHNLKVIYDAAHCFGVNYKGKSLLSYGDVSTCSFHATKIFHTGEGGCWVTNSKEIQDKLYYHHNFGHNGPETFHGLGINAKMSEFQAAMGLSVFPHLDEIFNSRKAAVEIYRNELNNLPVATLKVRSETDWNYHYFPAIFESEAILLKVMVALKEENIFPRRYFYPSLNTVEYTKGDAMPISESVASRILCLPLFTGIESEDVQRICAIIKKSIL